VTVPGKLSVRSFDATGKTTVRLVDALSDSISGSVSVSRTVRNTTEDVCDGGATTRLSPHRVRTVTYTCAGGAIVIGATVGAGVSANRGDLVTFSFAGRNGTLTLTGRVR
jgi:hypothetical protein